MNRNTPISIAFLFIELKKGVTWEVTPAVNWVVTPRLQN
jgi:hypothetical protein